MKNLLTLALLAITLSVSAQLTKEENLSSYRTNVVIVDGRLLANAEVFDFHNEIVFFENDLQAYLYFTLSNQEFAALGKLMTDYSVTNRDIYSLHMKHGGGLYIRFEEVNGYIKSVIIVRMEDGEYFFPELNRVQYTRLFESPPQPSPKGREVLRK